MDSKEKIQKFNNVVSYSVNKMSNVVPGEFTNVDNSQEVFHNVYEGGNGSGGYSYGGYGGGSIGDNPYNNSFNKPKDSGAWVLPSTHPYVTDIPVVDIDPNNIKIVTTGTSSDWIDYQKIATQSKTDELEKEIKEIKEKIEKEYPNKVDSDLVKGKLPYNMLVDIHQNLQYDFACAGYSENQIRVVPTKDGIEIKLYPRDDRDDLIGEENEYICKGIKDGFQTEYVFIDRSKYDVEQCVCELDNGILHIMVPFKEKVKIKVKKISKKVNI